MVLYNIYIYDRSGSCIHYHEWYRPKSKQMFGLFWTLSNFCATMDPTAATKLPLGTPRKIGEGSVFHSFTTNTYKLHFLETPSGVKIVLNTSRDIGDLQELMNQVYDDVFVQTVVKNPLYEPGKQLGAIATHFSMASNALLRQRGILKQG
eukprot:gene380-1774_t